MVLKVNSQIGMGNIVNINDPLQITVADGEDFTGCSWKHSLLDDFIVENVPTNEKLMIRPYAMDPGKSYEFEITCDYSDPDGNKEISSAVII